MTAFLLALNLASAHASPLPFFAAQDMTPYWQQGAQTPAAVTTFHAIDQNNHAVSDLNFSGRISLVNFFFAGCGSICPTMMHALQSLKRELPGDVEIYSFSVRPESDRPAVLKSYAESQRLDLRNWELVTGTHAEIYRIGRQIFKAEGATGHPKSEFIHTSKIYLVDGRKRIRGIYDSADARAMSFLAKDVAKLKTTAD